MQVTTSTSFLREFLNKSPAFSEEPWAKDLEYASRFGKEADIAISTKHFSNEVLDALYQFSKDNNNRALMLTITGLKNSRAGLGSTSPKSLKFLPEAIYAYLMKDYIDGWLYSVDPEDGEIQAFTVASVSYHSSRGLGGDPYVTLTLLQCRPTKKGESRANPVTKIDVPFWESLVSKKTTGEILAAKGFIHENRDLKAEYERSLEKLREVVTEPYKQYKVQGKISKDTDDYRKDEGYFSSSPVRCIFDEETLLRTIIDKVDLEEQRADQAFHLSGERRLAQDLRVRIFDLSKHIFARVNCISLTPYQYDKSMAQKIVLPEHHKDLIDVLTKDLELIRSDIVQGKSLGTTILCQGEPGLGKTLTAECYAELNSSPLYRVHSGQIGTSPDEVQNSLQTILDRASRWKATLLIDEADVFIRERGDDIQQNAIVAAFLQTLEYYSGLLFMTTNRSSDVDDAILSRCVAVVKYEHPEYESRRRIWAVLSQQMKIELSQELIDQLAEHFNKRVSGRDILKLLDLASRYAKIKNEPFTMDLFKRCAIFKGM